MSLAHHLHRSSPGVNAPHVHHLRMNLLHHVNVNVCECANESRHHLGFARFASALPLSCAGAGAGGSGPEAAGSPGRFGRLATGISQLIPIWRWLVPCY